MVATPHLAASTEEAQEQVGLDTANAVRDYLKSGAVRNAVNFPAAGPADQLQRLQPWLKLAGRARRCRVADGTGPRRSDCPPLLRRSRRERCGVAARFERGSGRAAANLLPAACRW
ncbi:MAG: hypothetical protein QM736_19350 [Vicinamibacterales bacterium]